MILTPLLMRLFSPRVALLIKPDPDHTFRVGISMAYRPPTLFETLFDARV